jgi:hypothetical protein
VATSRSLSPKNLRKNDEADIIVGKTRGVISATNSALFSLFQRDELPPLLFTIYAQHSAQVLTL